MNEVSSRMIASEEVVLNALTNLKNGKAEDAIARFAGEFSFKDHGLGLEFNDKDRLAEFFRKTQEFYPDSFLQTNTIFLSGDHVITEWIHETVLTEPFYGGLTWRVRVSLHGTSIVRTENGLITDWADYYDGLTSRRTALASYFTEWIEL
jgi:SnoaL-like polyketide cyclase